MSKPVFKNLLTIDGRRNRKSYIILYVSSFIIPIALIFFGAAILDVFSPDLNGTANLVFLVYIIICFGSAIIVQLFSIAQRCHDCGWSAWYLILLLIPVIGAGFAILMLIRRGDQGANMYGPDPIRSE